VPDLSDDEFFKAVDLIFKRLNEHRATFSNWNTPSDDLSTLVYALIKLVIGVTRLVPLTQLETREQLLTLVAVVFDDHYDHLAASIDQTIDKNLMNHPAGTA